MANNANDKLRSLFIKYANGKSSDDVSLSDKEHIYKHIEEYKKSFAHLFLNNAARHSAELNGILLFYGG